MGEFGWGAAWKDQGLTDPSGKVWCHARILEATGIIAIPIRSGGLLSELWEPWTWTPNIDWILEGFNSIPPISTYPQAIIVRSYDDGIIVNSFLPAPSSSVVISIESFCDRLEKEFSPLADGCLIQQITQMRESRQTPKHEYLLVQLPLYEFTNFNIHVVNIPKSFHVVLS